MSKPNGFKKVFAAGLAISTVLWTISALMLVVPMAQAQVEAHPAGTLVLSGGTVWKISDDGAGRMGFDSLEKFLSHRNSFSNVVPANSADLALPDQGLMPWGDGVLFNDGGTVFQVSGGQKHGFTSAAVFTGLGFDFADVVVGNLANVPAGANIDNVSNAHMAGTFVKDNGTVWMVTATGRKGIPEPGVLFSWGAGFDDVVSANAADLALAAEGNATFRTGALVNDGGTIWAVQGANKRGFPTASCFTGFGFSFNSVLAGSTAGLTTGANFCAAAPAPAPGPSTGTLTVSLASDTPAAATIVASSARVGFTKVNFTATGGDVVIDQTVVERTGISEDSNFSAIILLDVSSNTAVAQAGQIGNERTLGSTHQATFNDDITVASGTTKSILIAANMAATVQNGDVAKLQLNTVTLSGAASLVGSLPIAGNSMSMNNNVTITTATVAAGGQNPSATTQQVGISDYVVSAIRITNGSQEKLEIHSIKFTNNGSAADGDMASLELIVDGSVLASVSGTTSKVAQFNFASPIVLDKGNNKEFALRLDIAGGSGRTISLDIEERADLVVRGQTFGFFVLPTFPNTASPFFNANDTTIDEGNITFSKGVVASLNVAEGANSQVLGAFKSTVQGEPIRVTRFVIGVSVTGTGNAQDVTNLVVKDPAGSVVAGPVDPDTAVAARDTATSTDTIIFPVGTTTYTIEGDLNSDFAANDTVVLDLPDPDTLVTAKGEVTNDTATVGPSSGLSLDTMTVRAASLQASASAQPAAQSVIVGANDFVFANFVFDASASGEDVRINQLAIPHDTSANSIQTNIANLQLFNGDTALLPIVQPTAVAATTATSTFSLTNPVAVSRGGSVTLTLKGDVVAGSANQTHAFGVNGSSITATGVTTGNSVTATVTESAGQTMTIATSGTMTVAEDAASPQSDFIVLGNVTKVTLAELLVSGLTESVELTDIQFTAAQVNSGALNDEFSKFYLFDGATQIASVVPTTTTAVTFQNISGFIASSSGKRLTVKADVFGVTNNQNDGLTADSGQGVDLAVAQDAYSAKGTQSGTNLAAGSKSGSFDGKQVVVHKSVPTYTQQSVSGSLVNTTGLSLFKFTLAADSRGDVGYYKASFAVTTSTATVTAFELIESPGGSEVNLTSDGARAVSEILTASSGGTGGVYSVNLLFDTGTDGTGSGGEFRFVSAGGSKTFELRGTVTGSAAASSVTVVMRGDDSRAATTPARADGIDGEEDDDFIWSDLHYGNSSTTATQTLEWFNGYRVPGLSSTSTASVLSR